MSIAALHTVPGYRGASLAHHTITNLAAMQLEAFSFLPPDLRVALEGNQSDPSSDGRFCVADWNEGNPSGQGFFAHEGFEWLDEGVRWSQGLMCGGS